jgi:hypothetical protein
MRLSRWFSLLAAVVAMAIAPALPAADTTFKPGIAVNYLTDGQGWWNEVDYASIAYPDVTGDGKPDLCARGAGGIFCAPGDGAGNFATGALIYGPVWSDASGWNQPYRYRGIRFPDLNGDGKADVCGRDMNGVVCYLSTGTGFSTTAIRGPGLPDGGGWIQERYSSTIQFPDVNGDGKADCCYRGSGGVYCLEFASTGFSTTYKPGPIEFTNSSWEDVTLKYWSSIQFPDLNSDGLADVCARGGGGGSTGTNPAATGVRCWLKTAAGWGAAIVGPAWSDTNGWGPDKHSSTIRYADVSGDGLADVCARSYLSVGCILFTGTTFSGGIEGPAWGDPNGWADPKYYSTIAFPDINGDRKADVCGRDAAGITCAISAPFAFGTPFSMGANPAPSDAAGWGSPQYYATMRWVDLNGDVRKDLAIRGAAGVFSHIGVSSCATATGPAMFISETAPPASLPTGQQANVDVTFLNCSGTTWTAATSAGAATGYKLGSQWPQDNNNWGAGRLVLPASVPHGGEVTVRFTVRAPLSAGTYGYQWGIVNESVAWLSEFSPPHSIQVTAPVVCGGATCAPGQVCNVSTNSCCSPMPVYCNGACGSTVDNGCGQRFKCNECKTEFADSNWTAGTCTDPSGNLITPTNLVLPQLAALPGAAGQPQGVRLFVKPGGFPPGEYNGALGNHIQSVARLNGGAPYVLLSGDGDHNGHLFATKFPTKSGFERWGGIVNGPDSADIVNGPTHYAISPDDYSHAGGISVFGKFAAVPLQQDAQCFGRIAFFDLRTLPDFGVQPAWQMSTVLNMIAPQDGELGPTFYGGNGCLYDLQGAQVNLGSGAVAVIKSNGSLLIAVQGDRSIGGSIRWYRSSSDNILNPQSFTYLGRRSSVNGSAMDRYQNINFVRQCDGSLYLFAFFQDGTGGVFGQNRLHVFEVAELATPYPALTLVANMVLNEHSGPDAGDEYGKFGAGAGVYISKLGKIIIYSTQYYHNKEGLGIDPALQPLRMIEY